MLTETQINQSQFIYDCLVFFVGKAKLFFPNAWLETNKL